LYSVIIIHWILIVFIDIPEESDIATWNILRA